MRFAQQRVKIRTKIVLFQTRGERKRQALVQLAGTLTWYCAWWLITAKPAFIVVSAIGLDRFLEVRKPGLILSPFADHPTKGALFLWLAFAAKSPQLHAAEAARVE